jgi:hypothetical protein
MPRLRLYTQLPPRSIKHSHTPIPRRPCVLHRWCTLPRLQFTWDSEVHGAHRTVGVGVIVLDGDTMVDGPEEGGRIRVGVVMVDGLVVARTVKSERVSASFRQSRNKRFGFLFV